MGKDAIKLPFRLTREQMELRRLAAARDLQAGMKQAEVAHKYGASCSSVCRWNKILSLKGSDGLKRHKAKGHERKLPLEKLKQLPGLLAKGAIYYGYTTDLWTSKRVARLIQEEFGVEYSPKRVWSLLRELGLSWQRPKRRAKERDELARYIWLMKTWPEIKKRSKGAVLVFLDESGFSSTPYIAKTWAPRGKTPIIRHLFNWEKLSAISAITRVLDYTSAYIRVKQFARNR